MTIRQPASLSIGALMSPVWAPLGSLEQSWPPSRMRAAAQQGVRAGSAGSPAGRRRACPAPGRARCRSSSSRDPRLAVGAQAVHLPVADDDGWGKGHRTSARIGAPARAAALSSTAARASCHHRGRKSLPACRPAAYIVARLRPPCIGHDRQARSDMLNALRKNAGSWVVKVLMLLLVASFAIWGIGDVFFGGGQNPAVATVGGTEIPANELADAFNRVGAPTCSASSARSSIASRRSSSGSCSRRCRILIGQRLISLQAQRHGAGRCPTTPCARWSPRTRCFSPAGQFDRSRFDQLLRASGLSEDAYLASLRQQVVRAALTGSIAGPVQAPPGAGRRHLPLSQRAAARALRRGADRLDHRRARAERGRARASSTRRTRRSSPRPSTGR